MHFSKATLPHLAVVALIVQLMTPWQALHLGMIGTDDGREQTHSHCPTQSMSHHADNTKPLPSADTSLNTDSSDSDSEGFSDTCERACGLALSAPVLIALTPTVSESNITDAKHVALTPFFSKVPNPPPIA